jgi:serine/threonine protein kinase
VQKIGKYEIVEKIGVGGFGEVFKGYDPFIKRHVAVKTCSSEDESVRSRFFQEAEIAGNLHHRNVTTVYDFGLQDGLPYLIQEYLSGEDLDRKIKRRDYLPFPEKLYYLLQIARGLAYAHRQGVIHRDIKPSNIRILEDGTAKIMDFGIAKLAQQETGLTQTGMTLGTAAYLAPEQIRGDPVDHRTDVFSFGVLAYELLAYERPFKGKQISVVLHQILNEEPDAIVDSWPAAPPEMVRLIDLCLRKDPSQRPADGAALLKELERVQKQGRARRRTIEEGPTVKLDEPPAREALPPGPPTPAPEPVTESGERSGTMARTLAEVEFTLPGVEGEERRESAPSTTPSAAVPIAGVAVARRSRVGLYLLVAVLALAAVGVGWWLGIRGGGELLGDGIFGAGADAGSAVDGTTADGATADGTTPDAASDDDDGSGLPDDAAGGADGGEEAAEVTDDGLETVDVTPPPGDATATAAETPPVSPPPPAVPATGTLVLTPPSWTADMWATVGDLRYPLLGGDREVELPPGEHPVLFELDADGYTARREVTVSLGAGERQRLEPAIERPALLKIRPRPGRLQGEVTLDGEPLGTTPIERRWAPGVYTLEIRPVAGEGAPMTREVTLEPGVELILTFDLEGGEATALDKPIDPS